MNHDSRISFTKFCCSDVIIATLLSRLASGLSKSNDSAIVYGYRNPFATIVIGKAATENSVTVVDSTKLRAAILFYMIFCLFTQQENCYRYNCEIQSSFLDNRVYN